MNNNVIQNDSQLIGLSRWTGIVPLVGPLLVTVAALIVLYNVGGLALVRRIVLTATATFFLLGRFVILGGGTGESAALTPGQLALLVFYMDVMTAIIVVWHTDVLSHLPLAGRRIRQLIANGEALLTEKRWMRRLTLLSVVLFVTVPIASSGSVGGSLFGRLLGLSRVTTFLAVLLGSVLGSAGMYYGATLINEYFDRDDPVLRWLGPVIIALILLQLSRRSGHLDRM